MASKRYNIGVIVEGEDRASQVLNTVGTALGGFSAFAISGLAAVGAAATAAVGTVGYMAFKTADDIATVFTTIQRALGDSADATLDYTEAMRTLFRQNVGENFDQLAATIIEVENNTQRLGNISQTVLEQMTRDSLRVSDIYGVDTRESLGAATTLMQQFGLTSQQAFDFIVTGQQRGLNSSSDFLDTITEYSTQFSEAGAEADQFFSLLETGVGSGTFLGTDRVADLFKEFRLRILDGSKATAEGLQLLGINSEQMLQQLTTGGTTVADVFEDVVARIQEIEDPTARMQAGVRLLGTQFEDLGDEMVANLSLGTTNLEDMEGAAERLGETTTTLDRVFRGFGRQFLLALEPGGRAILDLVEDNLPALRNLVDQAAEATNRLAEGFARLVVDFATGLGEGGIFAGFSTALAGLSNNISFDLQASVQTLNWSDFITGVDLENQVISFDWGDYVTTFEWGDKVLTLDWGDYVFTFDWGQRVAQFVWGDYITTFNWGDAFIALDWGNFVAYLDWSVGGVVTSIVWGDYIASLDWSNWIYTIGWGDYVITLDWSQWLVTINWGDYLITIDWANWIISIEWGNWIKNITWSSFISNVFWQNYIKVLSWSSFVSRVNWRSYIPSFNWRSYITGVNLAAYVPRFPGWASIASSLGFSAPQSNARGTPYFGGASGLSYVHAGEVLVAPQQGSQVLTADRVASIVRSSMGQAMNVTINVSGSSSNPEAVGRAVEQGVLRAARALGRV